MHYEVPAGGEGGYSAQVCFAPNTAAITDPTSYTVEVATSSAPLRSEPGRDTAGRRHRDLRGPAANAGEERPRVRAGTFVQGIKVDGRAYAGGWFDWLTPFSIFTGVALILGYALLGACFLIMKSNGPLQARMFRWALPLGAAVSGRSWWSASGRHSSIRRSQRAGSPGPT